MMKKGRTSIEKSGGVHGNERTQATKGKSKADQYAEFHKLDFSMCDSDKVEDVNKRGKVRIIDG